MDTVPAGEAGKRLGTLIDYLLATGGEVVLTRRGRPVAKLTALEQEPMNETRRTGSSPE